MTTDLNQKLGQLFFVGFQGYTLSDKTKHFLKTIQPGGIILFKNNIKNKKQVKNLIKEINNTLKIKPFIGTDQEGGRVQRLKKICTSVPSVWKLSKLGIKELLKGQSIISSELLELGFNANFSPVLDINSNPKNPIIGKRKRAISSDPKIVSKYGAEIVKLFIKNKIIPIAKHFPGHGDVSLDSHLTLPVLKKTKKELNNFELIPFKKAIQNKVPIIMAAHIQLPKIEKDKKCPASLSRNVLKGMLRDKLGFKGLIITDELNMKGITKNYKLEEASYKALTSGADILLFNHNEDSTLRAYEYLKEKMRIDKNLAKRITESYKMVMKTKNKYFTLRHD